MKIFKLIPVFAILFMTSCASVRVATDYDREANFNGYNTYAFFKPGIDKAKISDLDKRRILRAIDANMTLQGMTKAEKPDLLVSIFTKENERVSVYNNNFGWGRGAWGWGPGFSYGGNWGNTVSTSTEGTLYIDLIDAKTKELVWQGVGRSSLYTGSNIDKKEERIQLIVSEILSEYPPEQL
ncbi:putative lipoprotein [unidentified eubacterium SCB49]|nr:putative lipoprotein [unidentified eubacterium SCB49]